VQCDLLLGEFLARIDVRVLCPLESPLQLLQLVSRERGAAATLLPLKRDPGFGLRVGLVTTAGACASQKSPCKLARITHRLLASLSFSLKLPPL
jgi:hypothetical protein